MSADVPTADERMPSSGVIFVIDEYMLYGGGLNEIVEHCPKSLVRAV